MTKNRLRTYSICGTACCLHLHINEIHTHTFQTKWIKSSFLLFSSYRYNRSGHFMKETLSLLCRCVLCGSTGASDGETKDGGQEARGWWRLRRWRAGRRPAAWVAGPSAAAFTAASDRTISLLSPFKGKDTKLHGKTKTLTNEKVYGINSDFHGQWWCSDSVNTHLSLGVILFIFIHIYLVETYLHTTVNAWRTLKYLDSCCPPAQNEINVLTFNF